MASRQLIQSLAHFVVAIVELEEETINIDNKDIINFVIELYHLLNNISKQLEINCTKFRTNSELELSSMYLVNILKKK